MSPTSAADADKVRDAFLRRYGAIRGAFLIVLCLASLVYLAILFEFVAFATDGSVRLKGLEFWQFAAILFLLLLAPIAVFVFCFHLSQAWALSIAGECNRPRRIVIWLRRFVPAERSYFEFQRALERACLGLVVPVTVYDSSLTWPPRQLLVHTPFVSSAVRSSSIILRGWFTLVYAALLTSPAWLFYLGMQTGSIRFVIPPLPSTIDGIEAMQHWAPQVKINNPSLSMALKACTDLDLLFLLLALAVPAFRRLEGLAQQIEFYCLRLAERLSGLPFLTNIAADHVDEFLDRVIRGQQISAGVHVVRCDDIAWRHVVSTLIRAADRVVLTGDELSENMRWEIEECLAHLVPSRILIPVFREGTDQIRPLQGLDLANNHHDDDSNIDEHVERFLGDSDLMKSLRASAFVFDPQLADVHLRTWLESEPV